MRSYDGDDTQTSTSLVITPDLGVPSLHLCNLDLWEGQGSNPGKGMDVCKYIVPFGMGVLKIVARRKSSREAGGRGRENKYNLKVLYIFRVYSYYNIFHHQSSARSYTKAFTSNIHDQSTHFINATRKRLFHVSNL
ncbi:hypothetical protein TNCV_3407471 [Trichonephila clavipes]|nr:hypothetical protein TNCV_3407471 [Trichonephila clavipes]